MDLNNVNTVHFIGIGGIGISALARLLLSEGKQISGTNEHESKETLDALRAQGVIILLDTDPGALPEAECYIYSDAWPDNFPLVVDAARRTGKPTLSYFEALGVLANQYYLIAIAGAHGKTTTTAMTADVFEAAGLDPTVVVGSLRAKTKSNFRAGKGKYCIVEADEYRKHFHVFSPDVLVVTNIDADHLDFYTDLADIQDAFHTLALRIPENGFIVCDATHVNVVPILESVKATVIDYKKFFDLTLTLKAPGVHMYLNAAAVLGVAYALRIDEQVAKLALEDFAGTWRRSEYIGETKHGATVYDDYGHHPAEIETTLNGFREKYKNKRLVVAFQPHLHSRTKLLFSDFVRALSLADEVVLAPIHEARKEADHSVSSEMLAESIGDRARALPSYDAITEYLNVHTDADDLIITMGAGNVYRVAQALIHH